MVNHLTNLSYKMPSPAQTVEIIPIAYIQHKMDNKLVNILKVCEASTYLVSKANQPRYGGYQTAMAYSIHAHHPPLQTQMYFLHSNAPTGPCNEWLGPNYQQYSRQRIGPRIYSD